MTSPVGYHRNQVNFDPCCLWNIINYLKHGSMGNCKKGSKYSVDDPSKAWVVLVLLFWPGCPFKMLPVTVIFDRMCPLQKSDECEHVLALSRTKFKSLKYNRTYVVPSTAETPKVCTGRNNILCSWLFSHIWTRHYLPKSKFTFVFHVDSHVHPRPSTMSNPFYEILLTLQIYSL